MASNEERTLDRRRAVVVCNARLCGLGDGAVDAGVIDEMARVVTSFRTP